jgi:hypothetical protein
MWLHLSVLLKRIACCHVNNPSVISRDCPQPFSHDFQATGHALQVWSLLFWLFGEVEIVHLIHLTTDSRRWG